MQITVENVEYPSEGRKTGSIKAGGRFYKAWPDKLDEFSIGMTYDVEVEQTEYQGKTQSWIKKKPKLVGPNTVGAIIPQPNGHVANNSPAPPAGNGSRADGFRSPRQMFISEVVSRAMGSGTFNAADIALLAGSAAEAWDMHG